ncbi:MAG: type II toxin-antitoxin system VapC family toxin, partial [bacterium]
MSRIFLDANIWMYAAGAESSQRGPCAALLDLVATREVEAVTDAEVLQEFLYRYARVGRRDGGVALVREVLADLGQERILPVGAGTLARCADLME